MKKCPYCATDNFDNSTFCENCGMPLKPGTRISCPKCGKLVREKDRYCKSCGTYLLDELKCAECGKSMLPTDAFCSQCGASAVRGVKTEPAPAYTGSSDMSAYAEDIDEDLETMAESILNGDTAGDDIIEDSAMSTEDVMDDAADEAPYVSPSEMAKSGSIETEISNYLMEGGSYMAEENYQEAIKAFSKAIGTAIKNGLDKQEDRRLITLYIRRGEAFRQTGDRDRALDNYSRALKYAQTIFAVAEVEKIKNLMAEI